MDIDVHRRLRNGENDRNWKSENSYISAKSSSAHFDLLAAQLGPLCFLHSAIDLDNAKILFDDRAQYETGEGMERHNRYVDGVHQGPVTSISGSNELRLNILDFLLTDHLWRKSYAIGTELK